MDDFAEKSGERGSQDTWATALSYWRIFRAEEFDKDRIGEVATCVAAISSTMPEWRAAVGGDAAAAILTAARSGEVLGGRWDEVDLTARVWTVPATRMKGVRQQSRHWQQVRIAVLGSPARGRRLAIDQSACA